MRTSATVTIRPFQSHVFGDIRLPISEELEELISEMLASDSNIRGQAYREPEELVILLEDYSTEFEQLARTTDKILDRDEDGFEFHMKRGESWCEVTVTHELGTPAFVDKFRELVRGMKQ